MRYHSNYHFGHWLLHIIFERINMLSMLSSNKNWKNMSIGAKKLNKLTIINQQLGNLESILNLSKIVRIVIVIKSYSSSLLSRRNNVSDIIKLSLSSESDFSSNTQIMLFDNYTLNDSVTLDITRKHLIHCVYDYPDSGKHIFIRRSLVPTFENGFIMPKDMYEKIENRVFDHEIF